MKILHVSNFTIKWNGFGFWGIPYKLSNGFTRLGHNVFDFCDRDIADSFFFDIREAGIPHVNAKLIKVCEEIRPDMLLLGHCTIIRVKTIARLREMFPSMRIVHWNCDPLFFPKNLARLRSLVPVVDATFVTTAGEQKDWIGGNTFFMPNPVDASIETLRVFEKDGLENDLVFMTSQDPEKQRIAELIRAKIPQLKFDVRGLFGNPQVHGAAMFDALAAAKMGLNVSRRNDVFLYSSDRMSLFMGNGLLTFTDRRAGFDTIFAEDELAFYNGDDDLVEKIGFFSTNDAERRRVAERGWKRAHALFDSTRVAKYIYEVTLGEKLSEEYGWPA